MKKITTILALMLVQNSYALQLEGVNGVEIMAINGEKLTSSFLGSKSKSELAEGTHQVVVRYSANFDNEDLVTSRPTIFTLDLQQDTQISAFDVKSKYKAERAVRKGMTWEITGADNSSYKISNADILRGEGFMPYSDIEGLIATYNKEHNIIIARAVEEKAAAVPSVAPTIIGASSVVETASATTATPAAARDLATLYQQSTAAQKKAFRLWLVEQDLK